MINNILIGCIGTAALSFGVDDADAMVKKVIVDMTEAGRNVSVILYDAASQPVFQQDFSADGQLHTVDLTEAQQVAYRTETMTVPATGEQVTMMVDPQYTFSGI